MKLLVMALLTWILTTPVQAEEQRWWAFSLSGAPFSGVYGAAWNFPTRDQAISAANRACEERGGRRCDVSSDFDLGSESFGDGRCFAVLGIRDRRDGEVLYNLLRYFLSNEEQAVVNTPTDVHRAFRNAKSSLSEKKPGEINYEEIHLEMYHCPRGGETWTR